MPRRPDPRAENPGIVIARLDGTARRLLREKADVDTCLAELAKISTDPQLLGEAAGSALGAWQFNRQHNGDRVARMLTAAGADVEVRDRVATATAARLEGDQYQRGVRDPRAPRTTR